MFQIRMLSNIFCLKHCGQQKIDLKSVEKQNCAALSGFLHSFWWFLYVSVSDKPTICDLTVSKKWFSSKELLKLFFFEVRFVSRLTNLCQCFDSYFYILPNQPKTITKICRKLINFTEKNGYAPCLLAEIPSFFFCMHRHATTICRQIHVQADGL